MTVEYKCLGTNYLLFILQVFLVRQMKKKTKKKIKKRQKGFRLFCTFSFFAYGKFFVCFSFCTIKKKKYCKRYLGFKIFLIDYYVQDDYLRLRRSVVYPFVGKTACPRPADKCRHALRHLVRTPASLHRQQQQGWK